MIAALPAPPPLWRGWIHAVITPLAFIGGIMLLLTADSPLARFAVAVYASSSVLLFGVSALYHRGRWTPRAALWLRRCDHANIFVFIAGTYTPLALLALPPASGLPLLAIVWGAALAGVAISMFWVTAPRWLAALLYLLLGWAAVVYLGELFQLHSLTTSLVVAGGLWYTVGAVVYARKAPNPVSGVFGFHEVFHACTALAFVCHWAAMYALLVSL